MATYFLFSDEAGQYRRNPTGTFCNRYPFYVRSAVLIDVDSWITLKDDFFALKQQSGLPINKEIKWSYLWSLTKHYNNREAIPSDADYHFLEGFSLDTLYGFVRDSCSLLEGCSYCKIVLTVTANRTENSWYNKTIYKWHLQELMQRVEMEIESKDDNLAIMFFDSTDLEVEKLLREAYSSIYTSGDYIKNYSHIKDSISFEQSHHSFGIQIADYAAGIFNGFLHNFKFGTSLFTEHLYNLLRRDVKTGEIMGYGIREVPSDAGFRTLLEEKLTELLPAVDL